MPSLNDVKVTISTEADTSGVKKAEESLSQLDRQGEKSTSSGSNLTSMFGSMGRTVVALGAAFGAYQLAQKIEDFGTASVSSAAELEQTNMSFQVLIGNAQQANQVFADLANYANTTPFQMKDVTSAARQLLAFGEDAANVTRTTKQLGDVAAAGGGDLQGLSLVAGQVFAQGKMRAQDMYQTINSGGAGLIKIMADSAGGMQKLTDLFDKGGVPASMYFDAVNKATANGGFAFQGADKQAQTFNGRVSTLKDSVLTFGRELLGVHLSAEKGLEIKPGGPFDKMSNAIQNMSNKFQTMGPVAAQSLTNMENGIAKVWGILDKLFGPSLEALFHTIADKLAPAVQRWIPFLEFGAKVLGVVLYAAIWIVINVLNVFIDALGYIMQVMANVGEVFAAVWHYITGLWGGTPQFFTDIGHGIRNAISTVGGYIVSPFVEAYNLILGLFSHLPGDLGRVLTSGLQSAVNPIKGALHSLHIPGFATGVHNYGGGLALVGEKGPEIVDLPTGSNVYSNQQSAQMMGGGSQTSITIQNLILPGVTDKKTFIEALDQDTILVGRGLAPNMGRI